MTSNPLVKIPDAIAECKMMQFLSFRDCHDLRYLPKRVLSMPNLRSISLKNCNLCHVWPIISNSLEQVVLHGNFLNTLPHEISKYLPMDTTTWDFCDTQQSDVDEFLEQMWVTFISRVAKVQTKTRKCFSFFQPHSNDHMSTNPFIHTMVDGSILSVPLIIEKLYSVSSPNVISLRELSLRDAKFDEKLWLAEDFTRIMEFPAAICECEKSLFTEAFVTIFHEVQRPDFRIPFHKFFCTKECLKLFIECNKETKEFIL